MYLAHVLCDRYNWHPQLALGKWSLSRIINGCLAGMVSVCSGCDEYYPWMAAMIGCVAGIIYVSLSSLMVRLKIDDPLDAVAVHAGSGESQTNLSSLRCCAMLRKIWRPDSSSTGVLITIHMDSVAKFFGRLYLGRMNVVAVGYLMMRGLLTHRYLI